MSDSFRVKSAATGVDANEGAELDRWEDIDRNA